MSKCDELSDEQAEAEARIEEFLSAPRVDKPWISMHGLAGVGKTFTLARIARRRGRGTVMCALSGKAASNLTRKTGLPASTIHSALYRFSGKEIDDRGREELIFMRNVKDDRWNGRVILLDEDSMISFEIAQDLIATGARIVTTGDPGQLPPVKGSRFFEHADVMLTEIRRQALDSPIIRQAHAVRAGAMYVPDGPDFRVQQYVDREDILACDIILCWRNATRRNLNALKRTHLGIHGAPRPGEPVMCLKNDHEFGVLNGATYALHSMDYDYGDLCVSLTNERGEDITLRRCWFEDVDEKNRQFDDSVGFAFSYCATVHKAQGSEWKNLIIVDEYARSEDRARWLYTAITRASDRVLIQRDW
jgi:ATP-dependent exoDNAse (exonuclease V) alpha subunit